MPKFHRGPPNLGNAEFKQVFYVCAPLGKLLKFGHFRKGEGGYRLAQIAWSTFFIERGNCLIFFLQVYYRGITGVCVISLQFIGFSLNKHSLKSGTSILIRGKSAPRVPRLGNAQI